MIRQIRSVECGVIYAFNYFKQFYHVSTIASEFVESSNNIIRTRGNKFKLIQHHCYYDLRKCSFTNRVIPIWNSLSNNVVSADTVNTVWTSSGLIKMCYMITQQTSMASETVVLYSIYFVH